MTRINTPHRRQQQQLLQLVGSGHPRLVVAARRVIGALQPQLTAERWQKLFAAAALRSAHVHLAFENCYKNQNVAAALRTAECLGVQNVHLIRGDSFRSNNKKVDSNLSKSAERWLDIHYHGSTAGFLQTMRDGGCSVYAAHFDPKATPIGSIAALNAGSGRWPDAADAPEVVPRSRRPISVVFGNEHNGVSEEMRSAAEAMFFLPSVGLTQSFNVSVACAMTLYHLSNCGVIVPDLTEDEKSVVLCRWLLRTVSQAEGVLRHRSILEPHVLDELVALAHQRPAFPTKTSQSEDINMPKMFE